MFLRPGRYRYSREAITFDGMVASLPERRCTNSMSVVAERLCDGRLPRVSEWTRRLRRTHTRGQHSIRLYRDTLIGGQKVDGCPRMCHLEVQRSQLVNKQCHCPHTSRIPVPSWFYSSYTALQSARNLTRLQGIRTWCNQQASRGFLPALPMSGGTLIVVSTWCKLESRCEEEEEVHPYDEEGTKIVQGKLERRAFGCGGNELKHKLNPLYTASRS